MWWISSMFQCDKRNSLTCRGEPSTWQVEEGGGGSRWWPSSSRGPDWCPRTSALQWAAAYPGRQSNKAGLILGCAPSQRQQEAADCSCEHNNVHSVPKMSFVTATKSYDCLSSLYHSFPTTQRIKFILHHIQRARVEGSGSIYHMWCTGHMFLSEEWHLRSQVLLWFYFLLFCWCPGLPRDRKQEWGRSRADDHWGQTTLWAYLVCFQQPAFFIFWKDSRVWGPIWEYIQTHREKMMNTFHICRFSIFIILIITACCRRGIHILILEEFRLKAQICNCTLNIKRLNNQTLEMQSMASRLLWWSTNHKERNWANEPFHSNRCSNLGGNISPRSFSRGIKHY